MKQEIQQQIQSCIQLRDAKWAELHDLKAKRDAIIKDQAAQLKPLNDQIDEVRSAWCIAADDAAALNRVIDRLVIRTVAAPVGLGEK